VYLPGWAATQLTPITPTDLGRTEPVPAPGQEAPRGTRAGAAAPNAKTASRALGALAQAGREEARVVYAVGARLTSLHPMMMLQNLVSVVVPRNRVSTLSHLAGLQSLRLIDASHNAIEGVPALDHGRSFSALAVAVLHGNGFRNASALDGFRSAARLRAITLHGSPLAEARGYVAAVVALLPHVLAVDFAAAQEAELAASPLPPHLVATRPRPRPASPRALQLRGAPGGEGLELELSLPPGGDARALSTDPAAPLRESHSTDPAAPLRESHAATKPARRSESGRAAPRDSRSAERTSFGRGPPPPGGTDRRGAGGEVAGPWARAQPGGAARHYVAQVGRIARGPTGLRALGRAPPGPQGPAQQAGGAAGRRGPPHSRAAADAAERLPASALAVAEAQDGQEEEAAAAVAAALRAAAADMAALRQAAGVPARSAMDRFLALPLVQRSPPPLLAALHRRSPLAQHLAAVEQALAAAHALYAVTRPSVLLQRVFRGHCGRAAFRRRVSECLRPVLRVQRFRTEWWTRRYALPALSALAARGADAAGPRAQAAALGALPVCRRPGLFSGLREAPGAGLGAGSASEAGGGARWFDLYLLPHDVLRVQALLAEARRLGFGYPGPASGPPAQLLLADVFVLRRAPPRAAAPAAPPPPPWICGLVARLHRRDRASTALDPAAARWRPRVRTAPLSRAEAAQQPLRRLPGHAGADLRREFLAACGDPSAAVTGTAGGAGHGEGGSAGMRSGGKAGAEAAERTAWAGRREHLLLVRCATAGERSALVGILGAVAKAARAGASPAEPPLQFVPRESLARVVAACMLQSAARSWLRLRRMRPPLSAAVRRMRALRLMQEWWRWRLLRFRLQMLAELRGRVRATEGRASLLVFTRKLSQRFAEDAVGAAPTREARLLGQASRREASDTAGRGWLPEWVGARQEAWAEGEASGSSLEVLLAGGCEREVVDHAGRAEWPSAGGGDVRQAGALPRRNLLGAAGLLRFTFSSPYEAQRRAALLFVRTCRPRSRDPLLLLAPGEARRTLYAVLVQAAWRGFRARQWFATLRSFVAERLGSSLLSQRLEIRSRAAAARRRRARHVSPGALSLSRSRSPPPKVLELAERSSSTGGGGRALDGGRRALGGGGGSRSAAPLSGDRCAAARSRRAPARRPSLDDDASADGGAGPYLEAGPRRGEGPRAIAQRRRVFLDARRPSHATGTESASPLVEDKRRVATAMRRQRDLRSKTQEQLEHGERSARQHFVRSHHHQQEALRRASSAQVGRPRALPRGRGARRRARGPLHSRAGAERAAGGGQGLFSLRALTHIRARGAAPAASAQFPRTARRGGGTESPATRAGGGAGDGGGSSEEDEYEHGGAVVYEYVTPLADPGPAGPGAAGAAVGAEAGRAAGVEDAGGQEGAVSVGGRLQWGARADGGSSAHLRLPPVAVAASPLAVAASPARTPGSGPWSMGGSTPHSAPALPSPGATPLLQPAPHSLANWRARGRPKGTSPAPPSAAPASAAPAAPASAAPAVPEDSPVVAAWPAPRTAAARRGAGAESVSPSWGATEASLGRTRREALREERAFAEEFVASANSMALYTERTHREREELSRHQGKEERVLQQRLDSAQGVTRRRLDSAHSERRKRADIGEMKRRTKEELVREEERRVADVASRARRGRSGRHSAPPSSTVLSLVFDYPWVLHPPPTLRASAAGGPQAAVKGGAAPERRGKATRAGRAAGAGAKRRPRLSEALLETGWSGRGGSAGGTPSRLRSPSPLAAGTSPLAAGRPRASPALLSQLRRGGSGGWSLGSDWSLGGDLLLAARSGDLLLDSLESPLEPFSDLLSALGQAAPEHGGG
jgi:hypothetical protein